MSKSKKIKPGTILGEKYEIIKAIEKGGMGTVFEAVHTGLDRRVAIKVLHSSLTENKRLVSRFVQEAKMIAMAHHRNIVDVLDVGYTSDGTPFFVMEYLRGESLKARMKKVKLLKAEESLKIMKDVLIGLSFAHDKGIIHRDMKPGNIFLSKSNDGTRVAKILDFGISKLLSQESKKKDGESTLAGAFLGTPAYMSPEQAKGNFEEVDIRSDIYSCGVILYKMLTGMTPFKGDSFVEVLHHVINAPVPPPSFLMTKIPSEVDSLIMKAMERDPKSRYQDCGEFATAIDLFLSGDSEKSMDTTKDELDVSVEFMGDDKTPTEFSSTGGDSASESSVSSIDSSQPVGISGADTAAPPKGWSVTAEGEREPAGAGKAGIEGIISRIPQPWRKKLIWAVPAAVIIVAIPIIILSIAISSSNSPEKSAEAKDQYGAKKKFMKVKPMEPAFPPVPEPPVKKVSIAFTGFPKGSEIILNDKIQEKNPLILDYDIKPATIIVKKDGKELLRKIITPNKDMELFYSVEQIVEEEVPKKEDEEKTEGKKKGKKKKKKGGTTIFKEPIF